MKGLNLKHFKKVGGDDDHTVMRDKNGHEIKIQHKALGSDMRAAMRALPTAEDEKTKQSKKEPAPVKMAYGGEALPVVKPPKDKYDDKPVKMNDGGMAETKPGQPIVINVGGQQPQIPEQFANPAPGAMANSQQPEQLTPAQMAQAAPESLPVGVTPEAVAAAQPGTPQAAAPAQAPQVMTPPPAASAPQAPAQPPTANDPYGIGAQSQAFESGINSAKAGYNKEALAAGAEGIAKAAVLDKNIQDQQSTLTDYQSHVQALDQERNAFIKDYQAQHIDPNHFWSSKGTGQKIGTVIGLILGGAAGSKFLDDSIDRDINAQKSEMDKSQNLLRANMEHFKNMKDAVDMTRVMQMDIVKNKLEMEANKASDPLAKARAMQAIGKLEMDAAPILGQIAMRKTLTQGVSAGRIPPVRAIDMIVPKEFQQDAYKELKESQEMTKHRDTALSAFDKVNEMETLAAKAGSPIQSARVIDSQLAPVLSELSKTLSGKFTEFESGNLRSMYPKFGDSAETRAGKRAKLVQVINEKINTPILQSYGIQSPSQGRYNSSGASRIQESAPILPTRK